MNITPVKLIWESEFSELVSETYGRPYRLQQQDPMMGQDSIVRVTVPAELEYEGQPTLEQWVGRSIYTDNEGVPWRYPYLRDLWWHREFYPQLQEVVNDLHERGLMESGDYVIHAWW